MKFLAATCVLAAPFLAAAEPVSTDASYVLDVEYWGTVYDVSVGDGISVGDSLHGTLRISSRLAPRDFLPSARESSYIWNEPVDCRDDCPARVSSPSGFVTSAEQHLHGVSDDHVFVVDSASTTSWDRFGVDNLEHADTGNDFASTSVEIGAPTDFVSGDGLMQAFDVRAANKGGTGYGVVHELVGGVSKLFAFAVDRLRVTPKVCRF
jgi:hypothetical protein